MHISKLKKYYFIDDFNPIHLKDLDKNITLIWRPKDKVNKIETIYKLYNFCKKNRLELILSNNVKLALKLNLNGVYISAHNKSLRFNTYQLKKGFKFIGSAHNIYEINIKKLQKVEEIFISPIFKFKGRSALYIHKSRALCDDKSYKKIALGGINKTNIKLLYLTKFSGFAGINFFKKKGPE